MVEYYRDVTKTKVCATCKEEKVLSEYSPRKQRPLGVHYSCKVCLAVRAKEQRKNKTYTEEERLVAKQRAAEWRKENPLRNKKMKTNWRLRNLHIKNARNAERRAYKVKATPTWLTKEQHQEIESIYWLAKDAQITSGEEYHVDHIIPLKGNGVCGLHVPWNLQVLPADVNLSKHNRCLA